MKKLLVSLVFVVCLALSFQVEKAEASSQKTSNLTVKAYVTPTSISAQRMEPRTITVKSSVPGPNSFKFNPGDGSGWTKPEYGDYSRNYLYYWSQQGTYTYQGSVTNMDLGPGYPASGTAKIRY